MTKRGDIVLATFSGDYGKPRPAVVVQTDLVNDTHASIVVCPVTSHLVEAPLFRLPLIQTNENGLNKPSQIMVDKIGAVRRDRIKEAIGNVDNTKMVQLNRSLALWLGLG